MEKVNAMYAKPWCSIGEVFHSYLLIWGLMFSVFMGALGFLIGLYLKARRKYADMLNESYEKLKTLEQMKSSLTHLIIHDLSTPLAVLTGHLDLLKENSRNIISEDQRSSFDSAFRASQEIKNMISNLLDISKMEEGKIGLKFGRINIYVLLKEIADSMKILAQKDEKVIYTQIDPDIPTLQADREILKRIILNLLWNALKFSPPKSDIEIVAHYKKENKTVEIGIKDHGRGIPKKFQELIFKKFTQIISDEVIDRTGKGLGLYFCKLAVEAHGGNIQVESEPGKGSTFYFIIPEKR